jgi:hypothetical protein
MNKRLIILFVIIFVWTVAACSLSQIGPQRQASITSTPTRTPKPTFTATATPTRTLTPSPTTTPTNTPTPTPVPTDTPLPTATPLPTDTLPPTLTPTVTPIPLPTETPRPTTRPTSKPAPKPTNTPVPKPTNTPPPPFAGSIVGGFTHCDGFTAITGQVKHANGAAFPGVFVGVWSDAWQGSVSGPAEADGKYDIPLGGLPVGKFYVAVVRLETCNQRDGQPTAIDCQRRSNVITVTTTQQCTGAGAVQVPVVDFTGP